MLTTGLEHDTASRQLNTVLNIKAQVFGREFLSSEDKARSLLAFRATANFSCLVTPSVARRIAREFQAELAAIRAKANFMMRVQRMWAPNESSAASSQEGPGATQMTGMRPLEASGEAATASSQGRQLWRAEGDGVVAISSPATVPDSPDSEASDLP